MIGCLPTQALAFLAVFVYARNARNARDCVWMETGLKKNKIRNLNIHEHRSLPTGQLSLSSTASLVFVTNSRWNIYQPTCNMTSSQRRGLNRRRMKTNSDNGLEHMPIGGAFTLATATTNQQRAHSAWPTIPGCITWQPTVLHTHHNYRRYGTLDRYTGSHKLWTIQNSWTVSSYAGDCDNETL